ncbi:hypothetical protein [Azohydromonas aeria]|uniref:hypothetical protein n=1 Tax=Azohydromonas aeria TaxID=2590212 RepID=UPI0012FB8256|nr:hypothetical protein [Azohydromonas aeria]
MKSTTISSSNTCNGTRAQAPASSIDWKELFAAMPIGIVFNAVRELIRQRNHRKLVLQAFKR